MPHTLDRLEHWTVEQEDIIIDRIPRWADSWRQDQKRKESEE